MTLLAVHNVCKAFGGVHAISNVSFEIRRGAVHSNLLPQSKKDSRLSSPSSPERRHPMAC